MTPTQRVHDRVAEALRAEIRKRLQPGDRLDTEPRLAIRFGVSIPTIRNAVLLLELEGLVQRRQGSGTYVCAPPSERHVGVALNVENFSNPAACAFHLVTAHRIWERLTQAGYRAKLYAWGPSKDDSAQVADAEVLQAAQNRQLAALVVLRMLPVALSQALCDAGVPLIGQDDRSQLRVEFDTIGLVRKGLEALLHAGRRRIALLGWGAPLDYRRIGNIFRDQAAALGLDVRDAWIRDQLPPESPGAGWEEFREIWLAGPEKPDGLLVCDDVLYRDAAIAIRELGIRVPDELMVVTHFNKGTIIPHDFPVTLLEADTEAHADALADGTLAILRGETPPQSHIMLEHHVLTNPGLVPINARRRQEVLA